MATVIGSGSTVLGGGGKVVGIAMTGGGGEVGGGTEGAPDAMVAGVNFLAQDTGTGGAFVFSVPVPPADNGSPITDYKYRVGTGGSWISLGPLSHPVIVSPGLTDGVLNQIYGRAENASGPALDGTPHPLTTSVSENRVPAQVKALHANGLPYCGAPSTPTKLVGVDPLPTGASLSGDVITISQDGVALDGYLGLGKRVTVSGVRTGLVINNCDFGSLPGSTAFSSKFIINAPVGCEFDYVGWTTLRGSGAYGGEAALIKEQISGADGASTTSGKIAMLERCALIDLSNDGIKCASNGIIRDTYFGPPKHFNVVPPTWDSVATFNTGDPVLFGTFLFISKVDGNTNHQPPSSKTSDSYWQNLDPHSDAINPFACIGIGKKIYGNFISRTNLFRLDIETPGAYGHNINSSYFPVPNSNAANVPMEHIDFYGNILAGETVQSFPIHLSSVGGISKAQTVRDNSIQKNGNGNIYYPSTGHTITGNVEDYVATAPW